MDHTYWHRQTDKPLFPDILWSRPENKAQAGKLLIIGGNKAGFTSVAHAYQGALAAGAGQVKAVLPDTLKRVVGQVIPDVEYTASTSSGGFAQNAHDELIAFSQWADTVLLAGDVGRSSETAIALERFVDVYVGLLVATGDTLELFGSEPSRLMDKDRTVIVATLQQLQKLTAGTGPTLKHDMSLVQLVEALHQLSEQIAATVVAHHEQSVIVATSGQVSTTKQNDLSSQLVARLSVFALQNQAKLFEALTSAAFE